MAPSRSIGVRQHEMLLQHVGKEMVVAIPLAPVVERDDEEIATLQVLEDRLRIGFSKDRVAQWPAQSAEHGGAKQKTADRFGLGAEDFVDEVVGNVTTLTGERVDEPAYVSACLHR